MASQGAIAAATIGAVATIAATVLTVVLPKVLADPEPSGSGSGTTIVTTTTGGRTTGATRTTTNRTTTTTTTRRDEPAELFANKESAPVGATVLVSGRKFAAEESVAIRFGASPGVTTRAAKGGDFANVSVTVPEFFKEFAKPMTVEIVAVGKSSIRSARVAFTISG